MKNTPNIAKDSLGTQKGFSTLLGLLLFIVLAGSGLYLYTEKVSKEMPKVDLISFSTSKENNFSTSTKKQNPIVVNPPLEYNIDPISECVLCKDGETWNNKPCCTSNFDDKCALQNGVVRTTDLHPVFTWAKGCFQKAPDTGKQCSVTSDCLSGVCDLENSITNNKCDLLSKEFTGGEKRFYVATYSCKNLKPGICAEAISNRTNPGGELHTFEMSGQTLIEKLESGPIY